MKGLFSKLPISVLFWTRSKAAMENGRKHINHHQQIHDKTTNLLKLQQCIRFNQNYIDFNKTFASPTLGQARSSSCKCIVRPSQSSLQSQEPSFHPSFQRSNTFVQSNSGFPSFSFTMLCCSQNHCDNASELLTSGGLNLMLKKSTLSANKRWFNVDKQPALGYFICFEIKNAWGFIRSVLGHNEEIKTFFFDYSLFWGCPAPPKFDIFGRRKIFLASAISPLQNKMESNVWYQNLQNGRLPICIQYILNR